MQQGLSFAILKEDVAMCRQLGCDGISVGISTIHTEIDTERFKRIVEWAGPMGVTCNRVFDCAPDPFKALEDIVACGAREFHSSARKVALNPVTYINHEISDYGNVYIADEAEVVGMINALNH